ncbi:hypothetical protein [Sutcliffiella horikoshii]|uniref:hypothetical protein n=1 Tax=Sutcliffiella horikoshii TaxID=79883 RepID=UPI001CFD829C|nr:hypothetical protein [Sutcliffiella horikoshii]
MELTSRQELLKVFRVEASFYKRKIGDEYIILRNQARIKRRGYSDTITSDAVVMMVNPGSCNVSDKNYNIPILNPVTERVPFVEANSDQTQEQLMRLMDKRGWNHLVIINLSDICSGNIDVFFSYLRKAKEFDHSILSDTRIREMECIMDNNRGPVIVAWGTNTRIKQLAKTALDHSLLKTIVGVKHDRCPFYLHPRPALMEKRALWLQNINSLLGGQDENTG